MLHVLETIDDCAQSYGLENDVEENEEEQELRRSVKSYWGSTRTKHKKQKLMDVVNVRLWDPMDGGYESRIDKLMWV